MHRTTSLGVLFSAILFISGCKESLPVYTPPENILKAEMKFSVPADIEYIYSKDRKYQYEIENRIILASAVLEIWVTNLYEETIQDKALALGYIEIRRPDNPLWYKKISFSRRDIASNGIIDSTGILTLNPGQSMMVLKYWDFKDSSGSYAFWKTAAQDTQGVLWTYPDGTDVHAIFRNHKPILLKVKATIQLFNHLGSIQTEDTDMNLHFFGKIKLDDPLDP
jgi:hypothetical protein